MYSHSDWFSSSTTVWSIILILLSIKVPMYITYQNLNMWMLRSISGVAFSLRLRKRLKSAKVQLVGPFPLCGPGMVGKACSLPGVDVVCSMDECYVYALSLSVTPMALATVCMSLSPRPQRLSRTIWSGFMLFASCTVW